MNHANNTGCSVSDCARSFHAKGYCHVHYKRWSRHGDPHFVTLRELTTHCRRGHKRTAANTYVVRTDGTAQCIPCKNLKTLEWQRRNPKSVNVYARKTRENLRFGGNREIAIQRDGEKCVECGMTREEHRQTFSRDITVDHIDGNGRYAPKALKNNALENLQTMCLPCHGRKDTLRRYATKSEGSST